MRLRNLDKISCKTEDILHKRGVEDPEPIGPKALLPALEAASEETDETLQDMWANLLANAMDPNSDTALQRVFTETLKQFEPIDALMFQRMGELSLVDEADALALTMAGQTTFQAGDFDLRKTQVEPSAGHLQKLDCIKPPGNVGGNTLDYGFVLSALGIELYIACTDDAPD